MKPTKAQKAWNKLLTCVYDAAQYMNEQESTAILNAVYDCRPELQACDPYRPKDDEQFK